jgi:hypothetical protein
MILIILYIIFVSAYLVLKSKGKIGKGLFYRVNDYNLMVVILIAWILFGFFFNLDYNDRWGCIVTRQAIFSKYNIVFSLTALILTIIARKSSKTMIKKSIHIVELTFWITRLMIFKGGYAVGYAASPAEMIVTYDFLALLLRLIVIRNTGIKIRSLYLSTITLCVILIKIFVFPTQQTINWEYEESLENSKLTIEDMQGLWNGLIIKEEYINDTITGDIDSVEAKNKLIYMISRDTLIDRKLVKHYDSVNILVDSNKIKISQNNIQKTYLMIFNSEFSATLLEALPDSIDSDSALMKAFVTDLRIKKEWRNNTEIYIRKIDADSLIFYEGYFSYDSEYKLSRKTQANKVYSK